MTNDLPAALALERPCRPCQDDQHERCLIPFTASYGLFDADVRIEECCCDDPDRDPDPPRWHP